MTDTNPVILITGGAGFLGRALIEEFTKPEHNGFPTPSEVRIFDTKTIGLFDQLNLLSIVGDIRNYDEVLRAFEGVDIVIHAAAIVDWGLCPKEVLDSVNITGTENVIRACKETGVKALVATSTMDVVYDGTPIIDGDETLPYPENFTLDYARTKAVAEQAVLKANNSKRAACDGEDDPRLLTAVIRPCGMYGEADPYHITETLNLVKKGKMPFRIGNGKAVFQHVYVGNVAHGHILAAKKLLEQDTTVPGQTYLITDAPPSNFFEFLDPIMTELGYPLPPKNRSLPFPLVYAIGAFLELTAFICRPFFKFHPAITRVSVLMTCKDFYFKGDKAVKGLGYRPVYSEEEARNRTIAYFKNYFFTN